MDTAQQWRRDNVGRLLHNAIDRFETRILEQMAAAGHGRFSLSHVNITRNLDLDGTRATELARRAGITKQSMGELIHQLEVGGIIERTPDPTDRRAKLVAFTAQGRQWMHAFRQALEQAEREMESELGAEALQSLKSSLARYGAGRSNT